jgi:hypothetical protein
MPSTDSRRRIEVPLDVYAALTRAAADLHLPTAALASLWLQERLAQERPDLRTNPNTYRYRAMHYRRRAPATWRSSLARAGSDRRGGVGARGGQPQPTEGSAQPIERSRCLPTVPPGAVTPVPEEPGAQGRQRGMQQC